MLSRSFYIFASKMAGYAVRLLLPVVLVRMLSKADFGAYRQFFLVEMLVVTIFQLGVNQALYYFIPRDPKRASSYYFNSQFTNLVAYALAFAVIGLNRDFLAAQFHMPVLSEHFWVLAIYTVVLSLTVSADCFLMARERVKASAAFEISGQVLASVATLVAAFRWHSLEAIFVGLVAARLTLLLGMVAYVQAALRGFSNLRPFAGYWSQLRYGLVLGLGGTFGTVLMRLHEIVVSRYFGIETYAVYSAGCTEIPVLQNFQQALAVVSLGQFALLEKSGDWEGIRRLWDRIMAAMYGVAVPLTLLFVVLAKPVVILMFTRNYAEAVPIFQIMAVMRLQGIWNATLVLRAMDRNDITLKVHLTLLLVGPFLLYGGMKAGGLIGIALAHTVLMIGMRLATQVWLNRLAGIRLRFGAPLAEVMEFYRDSLRKLRSRVPARFGGTAA